jgi:hypothetical protein
MKAGVLSVLRVTAGRVWGGDVTVTGPNNG